MKHIQDYLTHVDNSEDKIYLRTTHFPVNMRLFASSKTYKALILSICDYLVSCTKTTFEGYKKPHGMSGANIAMPFNIITVVRNRNTKDEYVQTMINPTITWSSDEMGTAMSNCGSIRLKNPIPVDRYLEIEVEYYNTNGEYRKEKFNRAQGSFTIQHEIDHNYGVLITDY